MSKMTEFETLARRKGAGSINDHVGNYFDKTGKPPTFLQVRSLRSQVAKELKTGGSLRALVTEGIVLPSQQSTGRAAEWSDGIASVADQTPLTIVPSESEQQVEKILAVSKTNGYAFQSPETEVAISSAITKLQSLPIGKQQAMSAGLTALDFERRMAIKDTEAKARENELLKAQLADKELINQLLTARQSGEPSTAIARK